jgi:SAM-dependent methyltransferase
VSVDEFARSFGSVASLYDAARPDYPPEALDRPIEALGLAADAGVVDLAAGTGKLTRRLGEHFAGVVAIEPDDRMRSVLEASVRTAAVRAGAADAIPLGDATADAVFVGDAFHWFATAAAVAEIARVLRPGGGLVLLWNDWWTSEPGLPEEAQRSFDEIWARTGRADAQAELDEWRRAFDASPFADLEEARIGWELELTAERFVSLLLTPSGMAALPDGERDELRRTLERSVSGTYRLPIETLVVWTRLR